MALPVPAQSPGDKNVLEVLEDNSKYLEEIKATVTSDSTIIEGQYEILQDQLEIEEENQRLAALEADNAELRARRLQDKLGTGPTATPMSTPTGAPAGDGRGFLDKAKESFLAGFPLALASIVQGGGLVALGSVFGDSLGEFLGDNVGQLINDLGVDPAFAQQVDDLLTERTGSMIEMGGWSKLLFGKARYGIIAEALSSFLGIPSLTDQGTIEQIEKGIEEAFGEEVAKLFGGAVDTVGSGISGAIHGNIIGGMLLGKRGRLIGTIAGFIIDSFDLTSLSDPDKRDEIMSNVYDAIPEMLGIGAAVVGGRAALRVAGSAAGRGIDAARGAAGRAGTRAASAVSSRVSSLFGRDGGAGARATPTTTVGGTSYEIGSRPTTRTIQTGFGARTITTGAAGSGSPLTGTQRTGIDPIARGREVALAKYPRLAKLLRFPGIGSLISLGELYIILTDESISDRERVARVAGIFGGIAGSAGGAAGGAALGAIAGALMGSFGGPLAIATGLVGSIGGYFAGDRLVYHIANYLLGFTDDELPDGLIETIAPEMPEPPALTPTGGAPATTTGQGGATATPTSTTSGGTVNTTTANMAAQGATELSAANLTGEGAIESSMTNVPGAGNVESSMTNVPGAGNVESSRANTIRTAGVSILSPDSVRIIPQVAANQITERSLMLGQQSGNLNLLQPVQNVTNVTNNNSTNVSGGGGGGGNVPSGRSYNIDQSFNSLQRPAYA